MRSSNPPVGNWTNFALQKLSVAFEPLEHDLSRLAVRVLSNPRRLGVGRRRFGESHHAGVALDRQQELMKLESHPPFGRPIVEVAQGTLEAPKRPVKRQFGMLIHAAGFHATKLHASTLLRVAARHCVACAALPCQVLTYRPTIRVVRITIHNSPCFPDNPERVIND